MKRSAVVLLFLFISFLLVLTYFLLFPRSMRSVGGSTDKLVDDFEYNLVSTLATGLISKRLIFVGDVHGALRELDDLLEKVGYNGANDHLVFTGDLVAKGPHSLEVVRRVRDLGASCVMGNHDEKVVRYRTLLNNIKKEGITIEEYIDRGHHVNIDNEHFRLASQMDEGLYTFLLNLPVVLDIPDLSIYVVHAGLLPNVPITDMKPEDTFNMRNVRKDGTPTPSKKKGKPWTDIWNAAQRESPSPRIVIYGHAASRGLTILPYSYGLDTGCVKGRKLTALIWGPKPETISVDCQKYVD